MELHEAVAMEAGQYVMSPYTTVPGEPLRITQVNISASGKYVYFRVHALSGITAMAGGWVDSKAVFPAPPGFTFDRKRDRFVKYKRDAKGDKYVADSMDAAPLVASMLEKLHAQRAEFEREEVGV